MEAFAGTDGGMSMVLLKTITTTQSLASSATYNGTLWNAGEISTAYDAILFDISTTSETNFKLSIGNDVVYAVKIAHQRTMLFSSPTVSNDGNYSIYMPVGNSGYVSTNKTQGFTLTGWGGAWAGTVTVKAYGINF